jgi:hypothetical protein
MRWLLYETDAEQALAYPQMSDAKHPATRAFFEAQRQAGTLRPANAQTRMSPAQFHDYRESVRVLEATLVDAERAAGVRAPADPFRLGPWTLPSWLPVRGSDTP